MLKPKIIELYSTHTQKLHPNHHHLFHTPIHQRLTFSAQENTHWMKTVKAATKLNKQREKQFISSYPKITKFLTHKKRELQHQPTQGNTQENYQTPRKKIKSYRQTHIIPPTIPKLPPTDAPT